MERLPAPDQSYERAIRRIEPRPEDVLDSYEAEILRRAEAGELPCYQCGQSLVAKKLIIDGVYEGVVLFCPDIGYCGVIEY